MPVQPWEIARSPAPICHERLGPILVILFEREFGLAKQWRCGTASKQRQFNSSDVKATLGVNLTPKDVRMTFSLCSCRSKLKSLQRFAIKMTDNFSMEFFRSCERLKTNIFIIFHHIASCFIHIGSKTTSKHPNPLCLWWHLVCQQPKSETSLRTIQKPSSQLRLWGRWSLTQTRMKHIGEDDNILIKQLSHLRNWLSLFLYIQMVSNYTIPKVGKFKATCLCLGHWYGDMVCPVLDILDGQVRAWLRNCSQSKPRTCYLRSHLPASESERACKKLSSSPAWCFNRA